MPVSMIEFAPVADDNPGLALSPLLRGVQLTLDYIETNGPIGLTPLKALKRYFVQWAAERIPLRTASRTRQSDKVTDFRLRAD